MTITKEHLNACGIDLDFAHRVEAKGVSVDSRYVKPGDIFFAIKRETFDGHDFVEDAINKGACFSIVSDERFYKNLPHVVVQDVHKVLLDLGSLIKKQSKSKIIAITGSVGKTTTREWLYKILSNVGYKTERSVRNYNNAIGLPVCLTKLNSDTEFGIFELGSNHIGEISELSKYLAPDISIITNVKESHIGNFHGQTELIKEKISILDGLKKGGKIIFDANLSGKIPKNVSGISFGFENEHGVNIEKHENLNNFSKITIKYNEKDYKFSINAIGKQYVFLSACVFTSLIACGIKIDDEILSHFADLSPIEGRGKILKCEYEGKIFSIMDETYNSSPASLDAALDVLCISGKNRRIAIVGEMKELGETSISYHAKIVEKMNFMNINLVFFIGDDSLFHILEKCHHPLEMYEKLSDSVVKRILSNIDSNDIVLVKGSHSVGMHKILEQVNVL